MGVFEMINHFRTKYQITFTFPAYGNKEEKHISELKQLWPEVEILPFKRTFRKSICNKLYYKIQHFFYRFTCKRFFSDLPWGNPPSVLIENASVLTEHLGDRDFYHYINSLFEKSRFDLIQAEFYSNIAIAAFLNVSCPIIFIHHELRFIKNKREFSIIAPDDKLLGTMISLQKTYETEMLKHFCKVVLLSETDKKALQPDLPEDMLFVSPLGIRIKEKERKNRSFIFNNTLTFLGGEMHFPNKDGLVWFLDECFPLLKKEIPALQIHIIGTWSSDFISKYSLFENIKFLGFVENLDDVLSNTIMIVPIRIGSGIRMKILEAINYGIPFVTTSIGVEGLDFRNGIDCIIANDAHQLVKDTLNLISDIELQSSYIKNSQDRLKELYSFEGAIIKRQQLYDSLLNN